MADALGKDDDALSPGGPMRLAMADRPPEVPPSGSLPAGKTPPSRALFPMVEPQMPGMLGGAPRPFTPEAPRLSSRKIDVSDNGTVVHFQPQGMQLPKEMPSGMMWGMKAYRTNYGGNDVLQIRDVRLPQNMKGSGVGQKMYEDMAALAAKEGRALHSDSTVTMAAANRWMNLNRSGHGVEMNPTAKFYGGWPFGRFMTDDGSAVFTIPVEKQ